MYMYSVVETKDLRIQGHVKIWCLCEGGVKVYSVCTQYMSLY